MTGQSPFFVFMKLHRNSPKRYYLENAVYFVTTNTYQKNPYFDNRYLAEICINNLFFYKNAYSFVLYCFVIMPNHFHALIKPQGKYSISKMMQSFKKSTSRDINNHVGAIHESRLREGKQYSYSLNKLFKIPKIARPMSPTKIIPNYATAPTAMFRWQKSFYDHIIRDQKDFNIHYQYIINNPIRAGLVKNPNDYPFIFTDKSID